MKRFLIPIVIVVCVCSLHAQAPYPVAPAIAPNILQMEYFVDTDASFGGGNNFYNANTSNNLNSFAASLNVASLVPGFHRLYVRSKDANNIWSHTSNAYFDNYVVPIYAAAPMPSILFSKLEYFVDTFANFNSGTSVGLPATTNVNNLALNLNTVGVNVGFHRVYLRSQTANNVWSHTSNSYFDNYIAPIYATAPLASSTLSKLEYFVDTFANFGNGTPLTLASSTNVSGAPFGLNIAGLTPGFHRVYLRTQDASNTWSLTANNYFDNFGAPLYASAPPPVGNIVALEYFIDNNDLGFGNCAPIAFSPTQNLVNQNANIPITGLMQGVHRICIRAKDVSNTWSETNISIFDNSMTPAYPMAPLAAPAVGELEYFVDIDPGFGNATPIVVPANTGNVNNYSVNISAVGLTAGSHNVHIRSKQNPWSLTNIVPISIGSAPLSVQWLYVKGILNNGNAQLSWAVNSVNEIENFEIEKSENGIDFTNIGLVEINNLQQNNFKFEDTKASEGFNYYKIKKIGKDKVEEFTHVIKIFKSSSNIVMKIFPNPAKSNFNIKFIDAKYVHSIELIDYTGKTILQKQIADLQTDMELHIDKIPKGNYFIRINFESTSQLQAVSIL